MASKSGKVSISDRQVTQTEQITLPSITAVPKGLKLDKDMSGPDIDDEGPVFENPFLEVPQNITVKSQTIRYTPEGRQVVDVVLEWDEVEGASGYDVRVTKA